MSPPSVVAQDTPSTALLVAAFFLRLYQTVGLPPVKLWPLSALRSSLESSFATQYFQVGCFGEGRASLFLAGEQP